MQHAPLAADAHSSSMETNCAHVFAVCSELLIRELTWNEVLTRGHSFTVMSRGVFGEDFKTVDSHVDHVKAQLGSTDQSSYGGGGGGSVGGAGHTDLNGGVSVLLRLYLMTDSSGGLAAGKG